MDERLARLFRMSVAAVTAGGFSANEAPETTLPALPREKTEQDERRLLAAEAKRERRRQVRIMNDAKRQLGIDDAEARTWMR